MSKLYTVAETAEKLKVSRMTIYSWIDSGVINAIKIVGHYRIKQEEIERLLKGE